MNCADALEMVKNVERGRMCCLLELRGACFAWVASRTCSRQLAFFSGWMGEEWVGVGDV
jgi:hypothetical protein